MTKNTPERTEVAAKIAAALSEGISATHWAQKAKDTPLWVVECSADIALVAVTIADALLAKLAEDTEK
jgi:hypothetical protein